MKPKYIIFFVFLIFFSIFIYIICKSGNNIISKNQDMIIEKILNAKGYKANIEVTVYSNKTENLYEIEIEENFEQNYSIEKVKENEKFSGFCIELQDNKLILSNTNLNLKKIYDNYNSISISKNYLFLSNFLKELDIESIREDENEIIVESKNNYLHSKVLYLDKEKNEIEKMVITDNEQNTKIIIKYIKLQLY